MGSVRGMDDIAPEQGKPGRPRSERARQAVLAAARELLTDKGLPGLTVDDIAAHAGVSKATIYRWWPGKGAVLMDAFIDAVSTKMEFPADGDPLTRLRIQLARVARLMNEPRARRPFVALVAAGQHDPELAAALRDRFIASRRDSARQLITDAVEAGQLSPGLDADALIDMLYGALYYRLLISGAPLTDDYVSHLIEIIAPAARPPRPA
ncbi:TetR/AcrR family transcriptional regulator [Amycolatopsis cynarae]|uniref:TetR/AcrR family transcriptional regulator n=1 Tax=Amycolatopsis cynarae TaxID=2995223 RepID=A0ABY7BCA1_9PSEU|nr:TetR/AcrR family transcriptional regulator [Amycolatopsis sp. HUAS 11-8]WAL69054.1 TetR/AcrR family transcriptional regulator [Amycolatopsis sp. HUAS 11-8]